MAASEISELKSKFYNKVILDQVDESRLAPLREASPEPTIKHVPVDLEGIVPPNVEPKIQETVKCLSCTYSWEDADIKKWCFLYRNKSSYQLKLTMDFTGSSNLFYDTNYSISGDVVLAVLEPFEEVIVLQLTAKNTEGWSLTSEVNLKFTPSNDGQVADVVEVAIIDRLKRFQAHGEPQGKSILHWLHEKGEFFIDPDFPPLNSSLFDTPERAHTDNAIWRRARDFAEDIHVIDVVDPNDIDQGELGDCWILSSIAALSEHPDRIAKIIVTKRVNMVGVYQVELCINGLWERITLDEYFPCYPQGGPKYTKTAGGELYVGLLEKAFAKIYGSYEATIEGDSGNGMTSLTGCPVRTLRFKDLSEDDLWQHLMEGAAKEEDLITVSTSLPKSRLTGSGLITNHSYTILDAKVYKTQRLLEIRNPWGSGEWEGDWGDVSSLWTEDAKDHIKPTLEQDDGTFWMSFEDVLKFFQRMTVCYCEPGTSETRMPLQIGILNDIYQYIRVKVNVPEGGRVQWIGLHQKDDHIKGSPEYTDVALLVFKKDESGEMAPFTHFVSYKNYCFEEVNLLGGEYELLVFTSGRHLGDTPLRDVTITLHRDCECLVQMNPMNELPYLKQRLIEFSRTGDKTSYLEDRLHMYYCHEGSLHIWSVENACDDYEIEVTANLTLNNMITTCFNEIGNEEYAVDVPCQSVRLVTAAVIYDYKKNSGMTRNMSMTGRPV